jgi:hypothetical protein
VLDFPHMPQDTALLRAALLGYQSRLAEIEQAMAEIRKKLGSRNITPTVEITGKRRDLSAAARKRISAAQKKRWAEYKEQKTENS